MNKDDKTINRECSWWILLGDIVEVTTARQKITGILRSFPEDGDGTWVIEERDFETDEIYYINEPCTIRRVYRQELIDPNDKIWGER